jgi:hypothetical protein
MITVTVTEHALPILSRAGWDINYQDKITSPVGRSKNVGKDTLIFALQFSVSSHAVKGKCTRYAFWLVPLRSLQIAPLTGIKSGGPEIRTTAKVLM